MEFSGYYLHSYFRIKYYLKNKTVLPGGLYELLDILLHTYSEWYSEWYIGNIIHNKDNKTNKENGIKNDGALRNCVRIVGNTPQVFRQHEQNLTKRWMEWICEKEK